MAAVVLVKGIVRSVDVRHRKDNGPRFGREAHVLTELPGYPGETLPVTIFDPRGDEPPVRAEAQDEVVWVVAIEAQGNRIRATYRGEGGSEAALPLASELWATPAAAESAPAV